MPGSLAIVGTGICLGVQLTPESRAAIQNADAVLYLAAEPASRSWLESLRPDARSLHHHYRVGRPRRHSYDGMVDEILGLVRGGAAVCVAFYGHPGVFVYAVARRDRRAREEGFEHGCSRRLGRGLPVRRPRDRSRTQGCLSFEATDFLVNARRSTRLPALVLWQVSVIGAKEHRTTASRAGLRVLENRLDSTTYASTRSSCTRHRRTPSSGPTGRAARAGGAGRGGADAARDALRASSREPGSGRRRAGAPRPVRRLVGARGSPCAGEVALGLVELDARSTQRSGLVARPASTSTSASSSARRREA